MKRSYFVPLLVPAGFFLLLGIASIIFASAVEPSLQPSESEMYEYFNTIPDRSHLVREATAAWMGEREAQRTSSDTSTVICLWIGLILLFWALDRRRLFKRFRKLQEMRS